MVAYILISAFVLLLGLCAWSYFDSNRSTTRLAKYWFKIQEDSPQSSIQYGFDMVSLFLAVSRETMHNRFGFAYVKQNEMWRIINSNGKDVTDRVKSKYRTEVIHYIKKNGTKRMK